MDWRNPENWQRWADRTIDGIRHSFAHLNAFDMRVTRPPKGVLPAFDVGIRVVFDCHVVTQRDDSVSSADVVANPAYWIDRGDRCRRFDVLRYRLSHCLPDMIRGLATGRTRCYVAKHANYLVWTPLGAARDGPHYQAYFDLYRAGNGTPRLVMYVQSAYQKDVPSKAQRQHAKPFATLCAEVLGMIPLAAKGARNKARRK